MSGEDEPLQEDASAGAETDALDAGLRAAFERSTRSAPLRDRASQSTLALDGDSPTGTAAELPPALRRVDSAVAAVAAVAPKFIGRFEVIEQAGQGSFGVVYRARDPQLGRTVAVKTPRPGRLTGSQDEQRFLNEARHAAQLVHPGIVPVYEVGRTAEFPYIVTEFVAGLTLDEAHAGRPFSHRQAARLVCDVAQAIAHAHDKGIIHRDLKPSNVIVGNDGAARVMDFGLAKRQAAEAMMTLDGDVLGTPAYMSPEQALGRGREADARSDVYGLGAVLYQLLTGEPPFRGNARIVLHQLINDEPRRPRSLDDRIPADLETIVLKCLEKQPASRYASARELAEDLRRWVGGEPIVARPLGSAERVWRWCRRKPLVAALLAGLGLSLVLLATALAVVDRSRRTERETAQRNASLLANEQQALTRERRARRQAQELSRNVRLDAAQTMFEAACSRSLHGDAGEALLRHAAVVSALELPRSGDPDSLFRWSPRAAALAQAARRQIGAAGLEPVVPAGALPHAGAVNAVAFSPDGRLLATACKDGAARLWNAATGEPLGEPMRHDGWVNAVAFSPDGRQLVTASQDKTCRVWDAVTGKPSGVVIRLPGEVAWAEFRPGAATPQIATAQWQGTVQLWDAEQGTPQGDPIFEDDTFIRNISFSPDGRRLAAATWNGEVEVWNVDDRQPAGPPLRHDGFYVAAVCFSPDGRRLATAAGDHLARIWDVETGQPAVPPMKHSLTVTAVRFSPDGSLLATGAESQRTQFWEAATGRRLPVQLPHHGMVVGLAFSPDGRRMATASEDQTARLWDISGLAPQPAISTEAAVAAMALSPDGARLVTAGEDGVARLWDVAQRRLRGEPMRHGERLVAVGFSPDGRRIVTGSTDGTAQLWDAASATKIGEPLAHEGLVGCVAYNPDGSLLATASDDNSVKLWTADGALAGEPLKHRGMASCVAFSPDGALLATGAEDQLVRLWDVRTRALVGNPLRLTGWAWWVAFSPDGRRLATGSWSHQAQVWDVRSRRPVGPPLVHPQKLNCVQFSPDGKVLVAGCWNATAQLWDVDAAKPLGPPLRHEQGRVTSTAITPDGRTLLTAGDDGAVRFWSLPTATTAEPARLKRWAEWLAGSRIGAEGQIAPLTPEAAVARARAVVDDGGPLNFGRTSASVSEPPTSP